APSPPPPGAPPGGNAPRAGRSRRLSPRPMTPTTSITHPPRRAPPPALRPAPARRAPHVVVDRPRPPCATWVRAVMKKGLKIFESELGGFCLSITDWSDEVATVFEERDLQGG